jgi:hypothetical protein
MRIFVSFLFLLLAPSFVYAATVPASSHWYIKSKNRGGTDPTVGGPYATITCPSGAAASSPQDTCFTCNISNISGCSYAATKYGFDYCPANAIDTTPGATVAATCTVPANYSGFYSGTFNQTTGLYQNGVWSVVPTSSLSTVCPSNNIYNNITRTCNINPQSNNILPLLGGIVGIALAGAGLAVSSPLLLAGGLAVAAHAAILGMAYQSTVDTSKPTAAANALAPKGFSFELDPSKSLIAPQKNDNTPAQVVLDTAKNLKPKGGNGTTLKWTQDTNNNHVLTENSGSGQRTVATIDASGKNATAYRGESEPISTFVTFADDASSVVIHSAPITTTNPNTLQPTKTYAANVYNYASDQVYISEATYMAPTNIDGSTVSPSTIQQKVCDPNLVNCESTQRQVLNAIDAGNNNIKQSDIDAIKNNEQFAAAEFETNEKINLISQQYEQFDVAGKIDDALGDLIPMSPWEYLKTTATPSCNYSFALLGTTYTLSLCSALPLLHPALAFMFFFIFLIAVFNLFFERPKD